MSNPHFDAAVQNIAKANGESAAVMQAIGTLAQAQATLALAHESRTANLLAALALSPGSARALRLTSEIETRLGLGETK